MDGRQELRRCRLRSVVARSGEPPPGGADLMLTMRLNATVMRHASTSALMFGGARTTALLSEAMALAMRHVLGTPSSVIYGCEPAVYVTAGDGCEVWIERIGLWRNAVVTSRSASSLWLWERTLCATAAPHAAPVAHRMRSHKRSLSPRRCFPSTRTMPSAAPGLSGCPSRCTRPIRSRP
ncbi:fumarylacetoacetate hydrolase family protein [Dyella jiangningensis]|uniref:fumarylacetoacetate hydrolase family protein n=1 Tax=Dyella jiangningensis TaxID=1379159 RepID=UPI003CCD7488